MPLPATSLYAALLAVLCLVLSLRVVLGTPHRPVERAVRAHGNFAEYAPPALVLLGLLEGMELPAWGVHALGTAFLAGRLAYARGISQEAEVLRWRVLGMALTVTVLGTGAAALGIVPV